MLVSSKNILPPSPVQPEVKQGKGKLTSNHDPVFVAETEKALTAAIGQIENGKQHHYYSWGNFNLVRLIIYLIKQTGPVNILMTSYSFSTKSIEQLQHHIRKGDILDFRIILDNRVRVMSPKPFQMIASSFNYRCMSVHAKVALLWNENWTISIVTSQNATDNPKLERGTIFTEKEIFEFDKTVIEHEFNGGTS